MGAAIANTAFALCAGTAANAGRRSLGHAYDAVEDTETCRSAMEVIQRKIDIVYPSEDQHLGRCHAIWSLQKRLLKDRYGIDWKGPAEVNPGVMFD